VMKALQIILHQVRRIDNNDTRFCFFISIITLTKIGSPDREILVFTTATLISQFGASADTIRSISNPQSCKEHSISQPRISCTKSIARSSRCFTSTHKSRSRFLKMLRFTSDPGWSLLKALEVTHLEFNHYKEAVPSSSMV
jgi:hypothetical protein